MNKVEVLPDIFYSFTAPEELVSKTLAQAKATAYGHVEPFHDRQAVVKRNQNNQELFSWFKQCLDAVVKELELQCDSLDITLAWFNRAYSEEWHRAHTHHNSWASGILYLNESPAHTWFSRPSDWQDLNGCLLVNPEKSQDHLITKVPSEPGKLMIFPSRVIHSVDEHHGPEPRYTMSFNAFPSGVLGSKIDLTLVNIKSS